MRFGKPHHIRQLYLLGTLVVAVIVFFAASYLNRTIWLTEIDVTEIVAPEELKKAFEQSAFGRRHHWFSFGNQEYLTRWEGKFVIALSGRPPHFWEQDDLVKFNRIVSEIENLTGREVIIKDAYENRMASRGHNIMYDGYNSEYSKSFIIKFLKKVGFSQSVAKKIVDVSICLVLPRSSLDSDNKIVYGSIDVMRKLSYSRRRFCMMNGLTQLMGFLGYTSLLPSSVFDLPESDLQGFRINDQILIRTLFDKRLKPGMKRDEAMVIAREIIPQLVKAVKKEGVKALHQ